MDNYIVRIYRRDRKEPREIVGVVELVEKKAKKTFKNVNELIRILCDPMGKPSLKR